MGVRNHILALVVAAALLSTTSAMAQTEGKLFEGVSTYHLEISNEENCGITEDFVRRKALFPLSYSKLKQGEGTEADIIIDILLDATEMPGSEKCYGAVEVRAGAMLWSITIPFNEKTIYAKVPLFERSKIYMNGDSEDIGGVVEELMKDLVTTINMDNK